MGHSYILTQFLESIYCKKFLWAFVNYLFTRQHNGCVCIIQLKNFPLKMNTSCLVSAFAIRTHTQCISSKICTYIGILYRHTHTHPYTDIRILWFYFALESFSVFAYVKQYLRGCMAHPLKTLLLQSRIKVNCMLYLFHLVIFVTSHSNTYTQNVSRLQRHSELI